MDELTKPGLSIFQIEHELAELMALLEADNLMLEEERAIEAQIREYCKREVSKVDNLRAYMRHCAIMVDAAKQEAEIQAKRAASWKNKLDFLKGFCLDAMNVMGKKRLDGRTGYLLNKADGGKQALTITDPELVPDCFCNLHIILTVELWRSIMMAAGIVDIPVIQRERVPKPEAIRAAMEKPCDHCRGEHLTILDINWQCPMCNGTGKTRVPGARLEPRGSHIEVK